jgi:hypothetical protein
MRKLQLSLCFLALLLPSCSPRDFLNRRLAADLIAGSNSFRTIQQFQLRIGVVSNEEYLSPESAVLQHHGWVTATRAACTPDVAPPPCWDLELSPLGVDTFQPLIPPSESEKKSITILTAKRELVLVTGIAREGINAEVDFTWRWNPLNEVGAALYRSDLRYRSTAALRRYDDGWRLAAPPHPLQYLDDSLKDSEPSK